MSKGILVAVTLLVLGLSVTDRTTAAEPNIKKAAIKNEAEKVFFPRTDVAIVINYAGRLNLTAKMQAFSLPALEELWYKEVPLGKAQHRWTTSVWSDSASDMMYVGNGPLCAMRISTGDTLWSIKYDVVGIVQDLIVGDSTLYLMGTQKKGDKVDPDMMDLESIVYETVKSHLESPKIIAVNRSDGRTIWEFDYEEFKPYDLSSCLIYDPAIPVEQGKLYVKGKYIYCLNARDGSLAWQTKDKAEGRPTIDNGVLYANIKENLVALAPQTGSLIWTSSDKLDEHSELIDKRDANLILLVPGKQKDNAFEGQYKLYSVDSKSGKVSWKFDKGQELYSNQIYENEIVLTDKSRIWIIDPASGKLLKESNNDKGYSSGILMTENGGYLVVGENGVRCFPDYKAKNADKPVWQFKGSLAEHGGGLFNSFLDAMMKVATGEVFLRSVGIRNKAGYRDGMIYSINRSNVPHGGQLLVFPTRDKGIVGLSLSDGSVLWTVPVQDNPFLFTPLPSNFVIAATGKNIYMLNLRP